MPISKLGPNTLSKTRIQNDVILLAGKLNTSLTHFEVLDLAFPEEIFKMFS
jgi:hypothetical protein